VGLGGGAEGSRHCAGVAKFASQSARVDASDASDAETAQHCVKRCFRSVVTRSARHLAHDHAATEWLRCFVVRSVRSVVADVRIRERDDLSGVARIGDHFLVASHDGVEHNFAARHTCHWQVGPNQLTLENAAIGKHQCGVSRGLLAAHGPSWKMRMIPDRTGLTGPISRSEGHCSRQGSE